jgi:hypothetical protein
MKLTLSEAVSPEPEYVVAVRSNEFELPGPAELDGGTRRPNKMAQKQRTQPVVRFNAVRFTWVSGYGNLG